MRNKNKKQTLLKFCFVSKTKKNYIAARSTMLKYFLCVCSNQVFISKK